MQVNSALIRSDRGLSNLFTKSFTLIGTVVGLALLVVLLTVCVEFFVLQPQMTMLTDGRNGLHTSHQGMLDQETGVRGYLLTGDPKYLEPYRLGEAERVQGDFETVRKIGSNPAVAVRLRASQRAAGEWTSQWAVPAIVGSAPRGAQLDDFLTRGKHLFDAYRAAEAAALTAINLAVDDTQRLENQVLGGGAVITTLIFGFAFTIVMVRARRLRNAIVEPIADVLLTMSRIREGDLSARPALIGPPELVRVGQGLVDLIESVQLSRQQLQDREGRLREILSLVREIAGSLSLKYVIRAVADSASLVGSYSSVVVWLVDENTHLLLPAYSTSGGTENGIGQIEPLELGSGPAGMAAKYGRAFARTEDQRLEVLSSGRVPRSILTIPMIVGARCVGVIECRDRTEQEDAGDLLDVMETLATQAGTAVEAARLHEATAELSLIDSLTTLPNRRLFDRDLADEIARCERYRRPLSLLMIDVDHFKEVNDRLGHQRGDEILQEVASILASSLRGADTAYRYGGEEFTILLRETGPDPAAKLAERLRELLEARPNFEDDERHLTASFGVAGFKEEAIPGRELVAEADAALYQAKREGRNRVAVAPSTATRESVRRIVRPGKELSRTFGGTRRKGGPAAPSGS